MKVADFMSTTPITVTADVGLEAAARLMVDHRVSGLPVVDGAGGVIGMITEGDLIRRVELGTAGRPAGWLSGLFSPGRSAREFVSTHGTRVGEVMSGEVVSVSPEATLAEVVALMDTHQVKRLPVLQAGRLVGIISRADLLRALAQLLGEQHVEAISDIELRKRVLAKIAEQAWAPCATVDATVKDGVVELRGAVSDDRERVGLRVIAENTPGVRQVHDRLVWVEPFSGTVIEVPSK